MFSVKSRAPRTAARSPAPVALLVAVVGLVLALALFGTGLYLWVSGNAATSIGGPFTLRNQDGQTVTNATFRGKYMLVYFGYTYCPDVCPTTLMEVSGALNKLGPKAARLVPVFITVDPRRDTPETLKNYVRAFSPGLVGLTGSPEQIARVEQEYHVYAAKHVTGPGPNDYTMDHSSFLYLMGPDGRFVAPLSADENATQLADRLSHLIPD